MDVFFIIYFSVLKFITLFESMGQESHKITIICRRVGVAPQTPRRGA